MAKDVKFNIDLVIDGQKHIVQASADVEYLAQQLGIADRQTRNLTRSMINSNQIITEWQNLASSIKQIAAALFAAICKAHNEQRELEMQAAWNRMKLSNMCSLPLTGFNDESLYHYQILY